MSTDIGIRFGVQGESETRVALTALNSQIRNLNSEMRTVVQTFADVDDHEAEVAARSDVLNRSIAATEQQMTLLNTQYNRAQRRLSELSAELDQANATFGENSIEAARAQNAYNRQASTVNRLSSDINRTNANLVRMRRDLSNVGTAADQASDDLEAASREADSLGASLKGAFVGGAVSGAIQSLIGGISSLVDETMEYRKIMGTLSTSSQRAGYTAQETAQSFDQLFSIIGDDQSAATALANLQALGLSQDELTRLTDGAIGAWATYGDSIPIDGLAEAINETIKAGAVTGTFADVLNWAGTSEDDFNALLEATSSEAERVNLVMQELANQGLMDAAGAWRQNNSDIVMANQAQAQLNGTMAEFGKMLTPITAMAKTEINSVLQSILSLTDGFKEQGLGFAVDLIHGFAEGIPEMIDTAGDAVKSFLGEIAAKSPEIISQGGKMLTDITTGLIGAIPQLVAQLPKIIAGLTGYMRSAAPAVIEAGVKLVFALIKGILSAIPELVAQLPDLVVAIYNGLDELSYMLVEAGRELVQGIWAGIKETKSWIVNNIKGFCGSILGSFKDFFGIHSPSTVMRKIIGVMLPRGIAKGIEDGTPEVLMTADKLNQAIIDKEEGLVERLKDAGLSDATKEALQIQLDAVRSFRSEYETALNDIQKSQDSMADKLRSYGELFTKIKDESGEFLEIGDLEQQINQINEFGQSLQALESIGAPKTLVDEVASMDIDDAIAYTNELLKMSDKQFDQYAKLWETKQQAAQRVAEKFYKQEFDALSNEYLGKIPGVVASIKEQVGKLGQELVSTVDSITSADVKSLSKATEQAAVEGLSSQEAADGVFAQTIEGLQDQAPVLMDYLDGLIKGSLDLIMSFLPDFRYDGRMLMAGVADGVYDGRSGVVQAVKATLEAAAAAARSAMDIHSPSGVFSKIGDFMAQGVGVGFTKQMSNVNKDIAAAMSSSPQAATSSLNRNGGDKSYSYGDINLYIDRVDNGNGRTIETMAKELEFYRRQQTAGKGGR